MQTQWPTSLDHVEFYKGRPKLLMVELFDQIFWVCHSFESVKWFTDY
jgi:hypothetical protein